MPKIPRILKIEVGFFSTKKSFFKIFQIKKNYSIQTLFLKKKIEEHFWIIIHHHHHSFRLGREGLGCIRKSGLGLSNFFLFFFFFSFVSFFFSFFSFSYSFFLFLLFFFFFFPFFSFFLFIFFLFYTT